jgi:hypothetical protein
MREVPFMGVITSPRADTADSTMVTSGLVGGIKPPQLASSPVKRGSKSVVLAAHTVVPTGVTLAVVDDDAVLDGDTVAVGVAVREELGVPVWLAVCDADAVPVSDDVEVMVGVAVPVPEDEPVPV